MTFLHSFPTRVEGVLDVWDVDDTEIQFSEWKYCGKTLPIPKWRQIVCVCLENEQKLLLFDSFPDSLRFPSAPHITISRLSFSKCNHSAKHDSSSTQEAKTCLDSNVARPNETKSTECSSKKENSRKFSVASAKEPSAQWSSAFRNQALSLPQRNGTNEWLSTIDKRSVSQQNGYDDDQFGRRQQGSLAFSNHKLRNTKHDRMRYSASSLVNISIGSNNLYHRQLNGSTSTLSFDGDSPQAVEAIEPFSHRDQCDRRSSRVSFAQKLVAGIRRSLSLHQIGHHEPNSWKIDQMCRNKLIHRPLENSAGATVGPAEKQRCGSRTSRLLLCVRPNGIAWKCSNHQAHGTDKRKHKFSKAKTMDSEADDVIRLASFRYTASFPNSLALESRTSSSDALATSQSIGDSLGAQSTRLTHSQSTDSVQLERFWPEPTKIGARPTSYALTVPGMMNVGAVHSSLTGGRSYCFLFVGPVLPVDMVTSAPVQADADLEARIFAAPSELSRLRWIRSLRRTAKPNLENERHRENSLRLSILEARNLPSKRRYYCDICLDRTLYARTTSKTATEGIFWAEDFDLNNLPNVSVMTISLYKEAESGSKELRRFATARMSAKKLRKSQNQLIGFVTVPMSEISDKNDVQAWLTLQPPVDSTSRDTGLLNMATVSMVPSARNPMDDPTRSDGVAVIQGSGSFTSLNAKQSIGNLPLADQRTMPQIRIRARYRSVDVLPHRDYWALKAFLLEHSLLLAKWLDTVLAVKTKEEVASSLVGLHECNGTLVNFLTDLVVSEVASLDNDSMAFRSNTMATKAVECFVKLVGSTYLHNLLYRIVQKVLACLTAWEVNPEKLSSSSALSGSLTVSDTAAFAKSNELDLPTRPASGSLKANQIQLLHYLNVVWRAVQASLPRFPSALIRVFSSFRSAIEPIRGAEFCDNLISGCIFLRLICPALLSPSLFGLVSAYPSEPWCQRNLTLLAKSLQSLANFTAFDDKEPYMRFLNGYVSAQMPSMRAFIRNISNWVTVSGRTDDPDTVEGFRDVVDEGFELANLHLLLSEHLNQTAEAAVSKSNQQLDAATETTTNVSTGNNGLPEALSPLPSLLDDLTRRMDLPSATGTTRSLTRYNNTGGVTSRHLTVDAVDRSHATTLPTKHRKQEDRTDSLLHLFSSEAQQMCADSGSNLYAYHSTNSLSKPVPYYTLHQNPGFHCPSDSGTKAAKSGAVSILSVDQSFGNEDTPLSGGIAQSVVPTRTNPNDYDEPYTSVQSDSDHECEPQPGAGVNTMMSGTLHDQTDGRCQVSSNGPNVDLPMASCGSESHIVANAVTASEEPIYDFVPVSDDSSTDDMVDANVKYLEDVGAAKPLGTATNSSTHCPSLGSLLNEGRCFKPVPLVENLSLDSVSSLEDSSSVDQSKLVSVNLTGAQVERPSTIRLDQAARTNLSPRLLPKQVTTASMVLITPSSPTKPAESPTINIQQLPTAIRFDVNGSKAKPASNVEASHDLKPGIKLDDHQTSIIQEVVVNTVTNGKHVIPGIGKTMPVTRAYSDLDAYKDAGWTNSQTSSSNSLASIRGPVHSPESVLTCDSATSPEMLQSELVRLRQQLQLSREDAARAANRLSQQEAELAHLRQLLEQVRTKPGPLGPGIHHAHFTKRQPFNVSSPSKQNLSSYPANGSHMRRTIAYTKPVSDSQLAKTSTSIVSATTTTTFEELDDAMAKLEREQTELMREQARIRARLAASRPTTSENSAQPANLPSNPKLATLSVRSPKLPTASVKSPLSNHLVVNNTTRSTGVVPPNTASVQYGPRVRHGPPPRPRDENSSRYAY